MNELFGTHKTLVSNSWYFITCLSAENTDYIMMAEKLFSNNEEIVIDSDDSDNENKTNLLCLHKNSIDEEYIDHILVFLSFTNSGCTS